MYPVVNICVANKHIIHMDLANSISISGTMKVQNIYPHNGTLKKVKY